MDQLRIIRAENDLLFDEDGRRYIDLFSAHGTTWLGHANRDITAAVIQQLQRVWITGGLETAVAAEAKELVESFFPPSHRLATLYSTGMEAAEFALRVARVITHKNGAAGFERSTHGKSLATAYLGWDNRDHLHVADFHRLPFVPSCSEEQVLAQLEDCVRSQPVSAVFVEPLQGCGGGHSASKRFYQEAFRLCRDHNVLLVFDEILTGYYRTGTPFFFSELGFVPDIILIGKALGNGFPVSGVIVDRKYPIRREMLPGSTYAANPLAAATVLATLRRMRALELPQKVARIEEIVADALGPLKEIDITPRGKGALWILELPPEWNIDKIVVNIYQRGVAVGYADRYLRILPAATIEPDNLATACSVIISELFRAYHDRRQSP
jgi:4-aminobutyrate aminotransferase/(S)-3-amino-2-methylpropionate transaminase